MCKVVCQYCKKCANLVKGDEIFPERESTRELLFYRCDSCDAHVGVHKGTIMPLGTLAKSGLRKRRNSVHNIFDPLYSNNTFSSRTAAYEWLARMLNITIDECHIALFNELMCSRAIDIINIKTDKKKDYSHSLIMIGHYDYLIEMEEMKKEADQELLSIYNEKRDEYEENFLDNVLVEQI